MCHSTDGSSTSNWPDSIVINPCLGIALVRSVWHFKFNQRIMSFISNKMKDEKDDQDIALDTRASIPPTVYQYSACLLVSSMSLSNATGCSRTRKYECNSHPCLPFLFWNGLKWTRWALQIHQTSLRSSLILPILIKASKKHRGIGSEEWGWPQSNFSFEESV